MDMSKDFHSESFVVYSDNEEGNTSQGAVYYEDKAGNNYLEN